MGQGLDRAQKKSRLAERVTKDAATIHHPAAAFGRRSAAAAASTIAFVSW